MNFKLCILRDHPFGDDNFLDEIPYSVQRGMVVMNEDDFKKVLYHLRHNYTVKKEVENSGANSMGSD